MFASGNACRPNPRSPWKYSTAAKCVDGHVGILLWYFFSLPSCEFLSPISVESIATTGYYIVRDTLYTMWWSFSKMLSTSFSMGLLPDTQNCGLRMRRECRERFPRNRLQRKTRVSDPGMHHGSVRHVRAVIHVGIAKPRWREKRSRHSPRIRNPPFCESGKRPICNTKLLEM